MVVAILLSHFRYRTYFISGVCLYIQLRPFIGLFICNSWQEGPEGSLLLIPTSAICPSPESGLCSQASILTHTLWQSTLMTSSCLRFGIPSCPIAIYILLKTLYAFSPLELSATSISLLTCARRGNTWHSGLILYSDSFDLWDFSSKVKYVSQPCKMIATIILVTVSDRDSSTGIAISYGLPDRGVGFDYR
jgi:hypothetical protein